LLDLGSKHPAPRVVAEVAWAGAKLGRQEAVAKLIEFIGDWKTGERATKFLRELELGDRIPEGALGPAHVARCEMASWLVHSNELGEFPDQLEIVDLREIFWPPLDRLATRAGRPMVLDI
jgi:hypothetical protein